ncbi:MAG TPA: methyltransferase domain-containing protein [Myxococcota bacterium]|nr:methyltransferase domain-containing protein [Myxococcota bacterium]
MRVVDLDRDMADVIPTGTTRDSAYLFERMTEVTLALATPPPGGTVLDVASGFGQDSLALAARGARVVGAEPSARMVGWARLQGEGAAGPRPRYVRGWSDALPFADGSFDAVLCKGAIDHFDRPELAIAEMARVAKPDGRVVLAIANFGSLACRAASALDDVREGWLGRAPARGRRHYDVPADHFTRYDLVEMRAQAERHLALEVVEGVSLAWGLAAWTRLVERLPGAVAVRVLRCAGALARRLPRYADVVVLAGRPRAARRSASTSR